MTHKLADRLSRVAPSATMAMTQAARDLKARGADVIGLAAGEPDFDTPAHIRKAAVRAMAEGQTRYTAVDGTPALKAAVIAKFARDNQLTFTPDRINVSPGGKAVIFNALLATLSPGDEVIVPTPTWVSYPDMVRLCGGEAVLLPGNADFKITPEQLKAAISSRTHWLMLNSPSNPTGAVYTAAELSALGDVLADHPGILVLSDDIYEHIVHGVPFATLASVRPDLADRILTVNGVSKAYAMTGWRIGYAGGPAWLIAAMAKIMGQSTSCPSSVSQAASVAALNGSHAFLDDWRRAYRARRDLVVERLNALDGVSAPAPDGAFYVFVDVSDVLLRTGETDADLAVRLLRDAHVATVPGSAFHAPGHLRLSYATGLETLETACARIAKSLMET